MLKHILITVIVVVTSYFLFKSIYISFVKLNISGIKNTMLNNLQFFKKYSNESNIKLLTGGCIFYTDIPWSIKNNNYLYIDDRYYIIEPGYYYYVKNIEDLTINNNIPVMLFDNTYLNKIVLFEK
jgi:hypothetical protein